MSQDTPMMKQYLSIKNKYPDAFLFYRLGDFYEMFFDDAVEASKLLEITLTSRNKKQDQAVPLCGIPYHSAQGYINKLLQLGHKVAICEQTEDPKKAKGIVKRDVIQVLSPGTVVDPHCLSGKEANFLVSIHYKDNAWGLALADISTGKFKLCELYDLQVLLSELGRIEPKEILINEENLHSEWVKEIKKLHDCRYSPRPKLYFDNDYAQESFLTIYKIGALELGLSDYTLGVIAAGSLLHYLDESKALLPEMLDRPQIYFFHDSLILDENAIRNLELCETISERASKGSLFWLLDKAQTSMGSRLIKEWMLYPLVDEDKINYRLDAIEGLIKKSSIMTRFRELLSSIQDMERIRNRILGNQANARDLIALKDSLEFIPQVKEILLQLPKPLDQLGTDLDDLADIKYRISQTLMEEPSAALHEGRLIRDGYSSDLDELRDIEKNGKSIISSMEATLRNQTGISTLKIRYNKVFGYYIEVTNTNINKVPDSFIRKQTLANAERYINPELKEIEDKVLGASEKIRNLEYDLFVGLREELKTHADRLLHASRLIAKLDAYTSLAYLAIENRYSRPTFTKEMKISIEEGRHPLVESLNHSETFVPNTVCLDKENCQIMVITGPNMAGKSTVMRQVALISLMAQMGSFVPAKKVEMGMIDRIFTRIGASDHLQKGLSTFMVEMVEMSQILSQATPSSLLILDEIGRGTSTFDGLSIAWSIAESIHDDIRSLCMFATHYHELTDLAQKKGRLKNYHMSIKDYGGNIRFLRQLKEGGTNRSYGVQVAAMAGLPEKTISRAKEILKILETNDLRFQSQSSNFEQPSLFETHLPKSVEELRLCDLNKMTPLEALSLLFKMQEELG